MSDNKTAKYFIYGISEIIIVVIGILIAVSIDNRNESKKNRAQEIVILDNIKQDLISDTIDMVRMVDLYRSFNEEENKLLDFLYSNDNVPITPIDYNLALSTPTVALIHQSSFDNLQNNDPRLITNNAIRKKITRHYDYFVNMVLLAENEMASMDAYTMKLTYFLKYFKAVKTEDVLINSDRNSEEYVNPDISRKEYQIRDLEGIKQDEEFKIILSESVASSQAKVQIYSNFIRQTYNLIQAIDLEIKELSK